MDFDESTIDPSLRSSNPALDLINSINFNNATADENFSEDEFPDRASLSGSNRNATNLNSNLASFGRLVKRDKHFSGESLADFDTFCLTPSEQERSVLLYAAVLETRDLVKQVKKMEQWQVSEELKKSIRSYTQAFMLSPTTTSYRGNGPEHILKAMRELNVHDLPPEKEVTHVKSVLQFIRTTLTAFRNVLKEKIKASLEPDSPTRNIADLTHAIIANTPVKATGQHYVRIAFLRWHLIQYPNLTENDWWPTVDATIDTFRSSLQDAVKISKAFNELYQQDINVYGDPATTSHTVVDPKDIPGWIGTVNAHSANVQGKVSKKRKTTAS